MKSCNSIAAHMLNIVAHGTCGCFAEGRNRYPYWGWKEAK